MSYRENLTRTILQWKKEPIEDEWLFEKFREVTIEAMTSPEAFCAINETVEILVNETDESTACELVQTIINLSKKSMTTEIPKKLLDSKESIEAQFSMMNEYARSKLREMFRYYRL